VEHGTPVSIDKFIAGMPVPFEQRDLISATNIAVRVARFEGEFPWHRHDDDEIFLCWQGSFTIEMAGRDSVTLQAGELYVVPSGIEHRPVAPEFAYVLMLERPEVTQYGVAVG